VCAFVAAAACTWEISLGAGDGISEVRFEEDISNPAEKRDADIAFSRDIVLITAERSQHYLDRFGPDKIGSMRGVTLTIVQMRIDGVDLGRTGPPTLSLAGHEVIGTPGAEVELDDDQVDELRSRLLAGAELSAPLVISLHAPLEALDASRPSLHIVLVLQPTLHVDVTHSF
jgi:hypothetical protein